MMNPVRVRVLRARADATEANNLKHHLENGDRAVACYAEDPDPNLMIGIQKVVFVWTRSSSGDAKFFREAMKWSERRDVQKHLVRFDNAEVPTFIAEECDRILDYSTDDALQIWVAGVVGAGIDSTGLDSPIRTFDDAIANYKRGAAERLGQLDVVGESKEQKIDDYFVDVFLLDDDDQQCVLKERVLHSPRARVFVEGVAGSGKSTLLRHLAFKLASDEVGGEFLPLFVSASEVAKSRLDSLDKFLRLTIKGACTSSGKTTCELIMDGDNFPAQNALLFVDGIDEIDHEDRRSLKRLISLFEVEHPDVRIVVSSRPTGWDPDIWDDFSRLYVRALRNIEVKEYIDRHCAPDRREGLKKLISSSPQIAELAGIPFLLALIVAYAGDATDLPVERAKLIRHCVESLIKRRKRSDQRYVDDRLVMDCLGHVSLRLFRLNSSGPHGSHEFTFAIEEYLKRVAIAELRGRDLRDEADLLLSNLIDKTGLLQFDSGKLSFVHRSIWEFFVGSKLSSDDQADIRAIASATLWEEPIRLMVGLASQNKFENWISEIWSVNPGLALRALTETSLDGSAVIANLVADADPGELAELVRSMADDIPHTAGRRHTELACVDTLRVLLAATTDAEIIVESILLLTQLDVQKEAAREIIWGLLDYSNVLARRAELTETLNFVSIESGVFQMGNDSPERTVDEKPAHEVELSSFRIADVPLQNKHRTGYPFKLGWDDDPRSPSSDHPIIGVTWFEAFLVALWFGCRLPTEAEWEFSCRARGGDDDTLFDESRIPDFAWYAENASNRTHPPREKLSNSLGIFDMLGNVREWCNDWFGQTYYEQCKAGVQNPGGPVSGEKRVLRGGCFDWNTKNLVPSYRNSNLPGTRGFQNGVRLVEGLPPEISVCLEQGNYFGDKQ